MVGRFKSNAPINNFILFVYALIVKWSLFYFPQLTSCSKDDAYLYRQIMSILIFVGKSFPLILGVLTFLLFFIQAVIINQIFINQKLFQKPNHLAGMSFILFTSLIHDFTYFNPTLIACTFLVWTLYRFAKLQPTQDSKKSVFDIGMLFGMSVLFYSPAIMFVFFFFYGLSVMRPFRLTEWILSMLGIITPFYFIWAIDFVAGNSTSGILPKFRFAIPHFSFSNYELIAIAFVIVSFLVGFVLVQNNIRRLLVQSRKCWTLIYFFLLLAVFVLFQNSSHGSNVFLLMAVPVSCIASAAFFYPDKKWFPAFMHWGMFVMSLLIGYNSFKH